MRGFSPLSPATRRGLRLSIAVVALAGLAACDSDATPPAKLATLVRSQDVLPVPEEPSVTLTGAIAARVQGDLSFRFAGRIAERRVDVGDHVEAGQVLATLETREQEADRDAAAASLSAATATLRQAQANFDRQKSLLASGYATKSAFDTAQEALQSAQGTLDAAKADVATADDQLAYTVLKADAAGIITARNAEAGQVVAAAQAVFTLARDGARDAVFEIYESLLKEAPVGNAVEVSLVSDPSVRTTGRLREIAPAFDTTTGTIRVKVELAEQPPAMTLGSAVSGFARFRGDPMISLPWTSLSAKGDAAAVWVVDPTTKAVSLRSVSIGRYQRGAILVRDGLTAGERVVTAGSQFLRPGQVVALDERDVR